MKTAHVAVALSVIAAMALLIAGPGYQMDWWDFRTGFLIMRWAAFTGLAAAAVSIIMMLVPRVRRAGIGWLVFALVLGLVVAYVPWQGLRQARSVPAIHDITTDTLDPPGFVAILPLRADAPNAAEYEGEEVAAAQREAYPDIEPRRMQVSPDVAFGRALEAARSMGWEIVAVDPEAGRIEATDTTFWFGFEDDVVIRVRADDGGSRIDVRSVSRVGGSDVGKNAQRIRAYFAKLGDR